MNYFISKSETKACLLLWCEDVDTCRKEAGETDTSATIGRMPTCCLETNSKTRKTLDLVEHMPVTKKEMVVLNEESVYVNPGWTELPLP